MRTLICILICLIWIPPALARKGKPDDFIISGDKKSVQMIHKGKVKRTFRIIRSCGRPPSGESEIHSLSRKNGKVVAYYGNCAAEIDPKVGSFKCSGCE